MWRLHDAIAKGGHKKEKSSSLKVFAAHLRLRKWREAMDLDDRTVCDGLSVILPTHSQQWMTNVIGGGRIVFDVTFSSSSPSLC